MFHQILDVSPPVLVRESFFTKSRGGLWLFLGDLRDYFTTVSSRSPLGPNTDTSTPQCSPVHSYLYSVITQWFGEGRSPLIHLRITPRFWRDRRVVITLRVMESGITYGSHLGPKDGLDRRFLRPWRKEMTSPQTSSFGLSFKFILDPRVLYFGV